MLALEKGSGIANSATIMSTQNLTPLGSVGLTSRKVGIGFQPELQSINGLLCHISIYHLHIFRIVPVLGFERPLGKIFSVEPE